MKDAPRGFWGATLVLFVAVAALGAMLLSRDMTPRWFEATPASQARMPEVTLAAAAPTATEPIVPPRPTATISTSGAVSASPQSPSQPTRHPAATATHIRAAQSPTLPPVAEPSSIPKPTGSLSASTAIDSASKTPRTVLTQEKPSALATPTVAPSMPTPDTATPEPTPEPTPAGLYTLRQRMGVTASGHRVDADLAEQLGLGWYLDWDANQTPYRSAQVEYVPMIRLRNGAPIPGGQELLDAIEASPGSVWLVGNEPDVKWQDNVPPDVYARLYHDLYHLLKTRDPSCQVAIGGITQPSPLRLRYLDLVLDAYQAQYGEAMPVDVWNVHNFVLREERDSWGVDIPPGMSEQSGLLREIDEHDSLPLFEEQIVGFRRWMKERGQQDKPLIVTEYGILMPADYGFPPERVEAFMLKTFDFFRTATDPALGYPADDFRLVQRWCWYSLTDVAYPTGNLYQAEAGELTPLGRVFSRYAHSRP